MHVFHVSKNQEGRDSRPSFFPTFDFQLSTFNLFSAAAHPLGVSLRLGAVPCASAAAHAVSPSSASVAYAAFPSAASAYRSPDVFPPADAPYPAATGAARLRSHGCTTVWQSYPEPDRRAPRSPVAHDVRHPPQSPLPRQT